MSSHELSSSEGRKVLSGEFEPLAILAPIMKSSVPVFLDTSGVIGLDRVDDLRRLGELDDKLAFAASQSVRSADLVKAAGLHQVDVAQLAVELTSGISSAASGSSFLAAAAHSSARPSSPRSRQNFSICAASARFPPNRRSVLSFGNLGSLRALSLNSPLTGKSAEFPHESGEIVQ